MKSRGWREGEDTRPKDEEEKEVEGRREKRRMGDNGSEGINDGKEYR